MFTSHNHQRSTSASEDDPPPGCMTRPLIRCSSQSFLITIKRGTQQVKRPIPTMVRQDLEPSVIQTQILTTIRGEAPKNKRKPHQMSDKTFNQVKLKLEMTSRHITLYKITTILPLHQQGLASYTIHITMIYSYDHKYKALKRQRQHTYT